MKKILAFIMAITTCLCTFAACGDTDDSSESEKSGKKSSSEVKDKDDDDEDDGKKDKDDKDNEDDDDKKSDDKKSDKKDSEVVTEPDTDDADIKNNKDDKDDPDVDIDDPKNNDPVSDPGSNSGNVDDDFYLETFKNFCQLAIDQDTEGLMNLTFPDMLIDAMKETKAYDFMAEELDGSYDDMDEADLEGIELGNVTDCDAATKEKLEKLYSVYSNLFFCMAENGIMYDDMESGNIDEEKMMLIREPAMQLAQLNDIENLDVEITVPFEEAKFVTLSSDGEDQKFVMYKVAGEDWKMDTIGLAMFGF